ncbi:MAG: hypothetical protein V7646_553 [Pseudonocardia sp.]
MGGHDVISLLGPTVAAAYRHDWSATANQLAALLTLRRCRTVVLACVVHRGSGGVEVRDDSRDDRRQRVVFDQSVRPERQPGQLRYALRPDRAVLGRGTCSSVRSPQLGQSR